VTLERVLRAFVAQPGKRTPGVLNEILQVALYQILFLDRVPDFAAVNEAVEQAGRFHHRRKSGFVNGVLRTVVRNVSETLSGKPPAAADVLPVSPNAYRTFTKAVFCDPQADPAGYLAEAMSLPKELTARWVANLGPEQAAEVAVCSNVRAPLILRVNRLRADVETVLSALASADVPARAHQNGLSVVLDKHVNVGELAVLRDGLVQPQDATATAVVETAAPEPGMTVLDLCAAPGTKTTHLAERMGNEGSVLAVDVSEDKLQKVRDNCQRLGCEIVTTMLADQIGSLATQSFDVVLADVPCSNTGVLSRRAEARWRFSAAKLARLAKDQHVLATAGANFVKPGGKLVYSTCSIEPEECGQVAGALVRSVPRMELAGEELILPGGADDPTAWHDGGYVATFEAG
jgi:16S rRNA (cytosine967-C5)-methyltransferase